MKKFTDMLGEMVTSKKFTTLIAAISGVMSQDTVPGLFQMSEKTVIAIVVLIVGWMYAQGKADEGKSAAKIEAAARNSTGAK